MHRHACPLVAVVVDPQQRVGTTMTRQQRHVNIESGAAGQLKDFVPEEPGECRDTDDLGREPFQAAGQFGIASRRRV